MQTDRGVKRRRDLFTTAAGWSSSEDDTPAAKTKKVHPNSTSQSQTESRRALTPKQKSICVPKTRIPTIPALPPDSSDPAAFIPLPRKLQPSRTPKSNPIAAPVAPHTPHAGDTANFPPGGSNGAGSRPQQQTIMDHGRSDTGTAVKSYATFKVPTLEYMESLVSDRTLQTRWTSKGVHATAKTMIPGTHKLANFHLADHVQRTGATNSNDPSSSKKINHPFGGCSYNPDILRRRRTGEVILTGVVETPEQAAKNQTGVVGETAKDSNQERANLTWEVIAHLLGDVQQRSETIATRPTLIKVSDPSETTPPTTASETSAAAPPAAQTHSKVNPAKTQLTDATVFTSTHPTAVHEDTAWTTTPISDRIHANIKTELIGLKHLENSMIATQEPFRCCVMNNACIGMLLQMDACNDPNGWEILGVPINSQLIPTPFPEYLSETRREEVLAKYHRNEVIDYPEHRGFCALCIIFSIDTRITERRFLPQEQPMKRAYNPFHCKVGIVGEFLPQAVFPASAIAAHGIFGCVPRFVPCNLVLGVTKVTWLRSKHISQNLLSSCGPNEVPDNWQPTADQVVLCIRFRKECICIAPMDRSNLPTGRYFEAAAATSLGVEIDMQLGIPPTLTAYSVTVPTFDALAAAIADFKTSRNTIPPHVIEWVTRPIDEVASDFRLLLTKFPPDEPAHPSIIHAVISSGATRNKPAMPTRAGPKIAMDVNMTNNQSKGNYPVGTKRSQKADSKIRFGDLLPPNLRIRGDMNPTCTEDYKTWDFEPLENKTFTAMLSYCSEQDENFPGYNWANLLGPLLVRFANEPVSSDAKKKKFSIRLAAAVKEHSETATALQLYLKSFWLAVTRPATAVQAADKREADKYIQDKFQLMLTAALADYSEVANKERRPPIPIDIVQFYGTDKLSARIKCPDADAIVGALVQKMLLSSVVTMRCLSRISYLLACARRISLWEHIYVFVKNRVPTEDGRQFVMELLATMHTQFMYFAEKLYVAAVKGNELDDTHMEIPRAILHPPVMHIPRACMKHVDIKVHQLKNVHIAPAAIQYVVDMGVTTRDWAELVLGDFALLVGLLSSVDMASRVESVCVGVGGWVPNVLIEQPSEQQNAVILSLVARIRLLSKALEIDKLRSESQKKPIEYVPGRTEARQYRDAHIPLAQHVEGGGVSNMFEILSQSHLTALLVRSSPMYPYPEKGITTDDLPYQYTEIAIRAMSLLACDAYQFPLRHDIKQERENNNKDKNRQKGRGAGGKTGKGKAKQPNAMNPTTDQTDAAQLEADMDGTVAGAADYPQSDGEQSQHHGDSDSDPNMDHPLVRQFLEDTYPGKRTKGKINSRSNATRQKQTKKQAAGKTKAEERAADTGAAAAAAGVRENPALWGDATSEAVKAEPKWAVWGGSLYGLRLTGLTKLFSYLVPRALHQRQGQGSQVRNLQRIMLSTVISDPISTAFIGMSINLGYCGLYPWIPQFMMFDDRLNAAALMETDPMGTWVPAFLKEYPAIACVCVRQGFMACLMQLPTVFRVLMDNMTNFPEFHYTCRQAGLELSKMAAQGASLKDVEFIVSQLMFDSGRLAPPELPPAGVSVVACLEYVSARAKTKRANETRTPEDARIRRVPQSVDMSDFACSPTWDLMGDAIALYPRGKIPPAELARSVCGPSNLNDTTLDTIVATIQLVLDAAWRRVPVERAINAMVAVPTVVYVHVEGFLWASALNGSVGTSFVSDCKTVAMMALSRRFMYRGRLPGSKKRSVRPLISGLFSEQTISCPPLLKPAMEALVVRKCCFTVATLSLASPPGQPPNEEAFGHEQIEVVQDKGDAVLCHQVEKHNKKMRAKRNCLLSDPNPDQIKYFFAERPQDMSCGDVEVDFIPHVGTIVHLRGPNFKSPCIANTGGMTLIVATCCGHQVDMYYCTVSVAAGQVYCNSCREPHMRRPAASQKRTRNGIQTCSACMEQNDNGVAIIELMDSPDIGMTYELRPAFLCKDCHPAVQAHMTKTRIDAWDYYRGKQLQLSVISRKLILEATSPKGWNNATVGFQSTLEHATAKKRPKRTGNLFCPTDCSRLKEWYVPISLV